MSRVAGLIEVLKEQWTIPRKAIHRGKKCPFLLRCSFDPEPAVTLAKTHLAIPVDVRDFWLVCRKADLFKDQEFGQWGVQILSLEQALHETSCQIAQRPQDFVSSDLVLGRFFGDSDLVVVNCAAEQIDFGSVAIALPIDRRSDWPIVAKSFADFLEGLLRSGGDKYWEVAK